MWDRKRGVGRKRERERERERRGFIWKGKGGGWSEEMEKENLDREGDREGEDVQEGERREGEWGRRIERGWMGKE